MNVFNNDLMSTFLERATNPSAHDVVAIDPVSSCLLGNPIGSSSSKLTVSRILLLVYRILLARINRIRLLIYWILLLVTYRWPLKGFIVVSCHVGVVRSGRLSSHTEKTQRPKNKKNHNSAGSDCANHST